MTAIIIPTWAIWAWFGMSIFQAVFGVVTIKVTRRAKSKDELRDTFE